MKTYVISLQESIARRRYMSTQLQQLGVHWTFFDAIPGRRALECFEGLDERAYFAATGRIVSAGEIGCFASHAALWKLCADLREPIVVLEDDASLNPEYLRSIYAVARVINGLGFVRLQDGVRPQSRRKVSGNLAQCFEIHRCRKYPYGAMAYAISPTIARNFYCQSRLLAEPVDSFLRRFWCHGVPLYCILPATVTAGPLARDTTIRGRFKSHPGVAQRRIRISRKTMDVMLRALFNRRFS